MGDHFQFSTRSAAIGLSLVSIALVTALVVVVSAGETLATVALVIAIVAFLSQMVVAIVQFSVGATQQDQLARITGDLQNQVTAMHATTSGVADTQREQMGKLLETVMLELRSRAKTPEQVGALEDVSSMTFRAVASAKGAPLSWAETHSNAPAAPSQSDGLADDFVDWLVRQGYSPSIRLGGAAFSWQPEGAPRHEAFVRARTKLDSPHDFIAALELAKPLSFTDEVGVLVIPGEPRFEEWTRLADENRVVVVWPGRYEALIPES